MSRVYTLAREGLEIGVSACGAELQFLRLDGHDYLWDGDAKYWPDRAFHIFPYIARLWDESYTLRGKRYHLDIHGFVKDRELQAQEVDGALCLELSADEDTLREYPCDFVFRVEYRLDGHTVQVRYAVENRGREEMFYGLGGHPGFHVPLEEGLRFDDYELLFSEARTVTNTTFSPELYVTGEEPFPLEEGVRLPLRHSVFDADALVLRGTCGAVTLRSDKGARAVRMDYTDFPYLGVWHTPQTDAPFVCLEPWSSLPGRHGVIEELTEQPDLLRLAPGQTKACGWSVALE